MYIIVYTSIYRLFSLSLSPYIVNSVEVSTEVIGHGSGVGNVRTEKRCEVWGWAAQGSHGKVCFFLGGREKCNKEVKEYWNRYFGVLSIDQRDREVL